MSEPQRRDDETRRRTAPKVSPEVSPPPPSPAPVSSSEPARLTETHWLTVALEEYRALRTEFIESIRYQHQVLVYAFAIIGALTVGAAQAWRPAILISCIIFLFAIPSLAYSFVFIWMGEIQRMSRALSQLAHLEAEINHALPRPAFLWEEWRRREKGLVKEGQRKRMHSLAHSKAVLALLSGTGLFAMPIGNIAVAQAQGQFSGSAWWISTGWGFPIAVKPLVLFLSVSNVVTFALVLTWVFRRVRYMEEYWLWPKPFPSGADANAKEARPVATYSELGNRLP